MSPPAGLNLALRTGRRAIAGLLLAVSLSGCGSGGAGSPNPGSDRPSVVLIVVDTLRADRLGLHGAARNASPHIDRLGGSGVVYTRAYSQAPWTTASIGSLLTSQYPSTLGIGDLDSPLGEELTLLPEVLQAAGYATGAAVSHRLCASRWGFDQGYDVFDETQVAGHDGISSPGVSDAGIAFIDAQGDRPFFLLLHYFDPHFSYLEHEGFDFAEEGHRYRGWIRSGIQPKYVVGRRLKPPDVRELLRLYDSEVAFMDHHVGRVLEHLRRIGRFASSLVIFTADHGEEFFDHGGVSHMHTLYDELVRVPLIVKYPHGEGALVSTPVALVDVFPTVLDVVGLPLPRELRGRSLRGLEDTRPVFTSVARKRNLRAVVEGRWKLIHDLDRDRYALYDLDADPRERRDLAEKHPARVRALSDDLAEWVAANPVPAQAKRVDLSEDDVRQLRELGYLE